MKRVIKYFYIGLIIFLMAGCSKVNRDQTSSSDQALSMNPIQVTEAVSNSPSKENEDSLQSQTQMITKEFPEETVISDLGKYQLLNLNLREHEQNIIDKLGKKFTYTYDIYDGGAWVELRSFLEDVGVRITTAKSLKKSADDQEGTSCITEIDVYTADYSTTEGIKVGDSLEDVIDTYQLNGYYRFDQYPEEYDKICAMLSERNNHTGKYSKCNYDFNYGVIEKVAYLSWYDEHNHLSYRPALIFLFDEDIVTHIILYDWTYEVV